MKKPLLLRKLFSPVTWGFISMIATAVTGGIVLISTNKLQTSQDIRQQASTGDVSSVSFRLRADKTTVSKDQTVIVDVMMNTGDQRISAVSLAGQIKGVTATVTLSNTSESGLSTIYTNQKTTNNIINWKSIVFATSSNNELYSTSNREVVLASLVIKPTATGTLTVTNTAELTGLSPSSSSVAVLAPLTITVTEAQASGPPDQGIHRNCNEYCADSRECASQYTCYYNRCRNPRNINNEQCNNPPSPSPVSAPPKGGNAATASKSKKIPLAKVVDIKSKPVVTDVTVTKGSTKSASTPTPTPSQRPSSTPIPTPSPSQSPSPSPEVTPENEKGGSNIFIIALLVTLLIGGIAGLAYVVIKYRG